MYAKLGSRRHHRLVRTWLVLGVGLACLPRSGKAAPGRRHPLPARPLRQRPRLPAAREGVPAGRLRQPRHLRRRAPDGTLTTHDLALVDAIVADLNRLRQDEPDLQIKKIYSHRDPFIGKRPAQRRRPLHAGPGLPGHALPGAADAGDASIGPSRSSASASPSTARPAAGLRHRPGRHWPRPDRRQRRQPRQHDARDRAPRHRHPAVRLPLAAAGPGAAGDHRRGGVGGAEGPGAVTLIPGFTWSTSARSSPSSCSTARGPTTACSSSAATARSWRRGRREPRRWRGSVGGVGGALAASAGHGHRRPGPDGARRVRQGALRRAGHRPRAWPWPWLAR